MVATAVDQEHSVTPRELFFDLVFVFAFTQVTTLLTDDPTFAGIGRGVLVLAALWWPWTAYAWLTNTVDPEEGFVGPQTLGGAGVSLMLYVRDVDATFARAVAAGATVRRPVADQFYGDRVGTLTDPFGHVWSIATHREDVSVEEAKRRMASLSVK